MFFLKLILIKKKLRRSCDSIPPVMYSINSMSSIEKNYVRIEKKNECSRAACCFRIRRNNE